MTSARDLEFRPGGGFVPAERLDHELAAPSRRARAPRLGGGVALGLCAYAASVAAFASQSVTLGIALLGAAQVGFLASLWRRRRARAQDPLAHRWSSTPPPEPWELVTPRVSVVRLSALGWPSDAPGSEFNLN